MGNPFFYVLKNPVLHTGYQTGRIVFRPIRVQFVYATEKNLPSC